MRLLLTLSLVAAAAYPQETRLGDGVEVRPELKRSIQRNALSSPVVPPSAWFVTSDRSAVAQSYTSYYLPTLGYALQWTGDLETGSAGSTSPEYRDAVLKRINWFRAMAGVPPWVTLDETLNAKDQQGALMLAANRVLSHTPPPSWQFYTAPGAEALAHSNLCQGLQSDAGCIAQYMADQGANNWAVGHRRWILYPQTMRMGTGDVPSEGNLWNALWVIDENTYFNARPAVRDEFVAWPPKGYVPYQAVFPRWSFSYPGADFSAATVTMTRAGSAVPLRIEPLAAYTGENTIVWVPENQSTTGMVTPIPPAADTAYDITVANVRVGGQSRTFTYRTVVFDPGAGPVVTFEPPSASFPAAGGIASVRVLIDPPGSSFTASTAESWIHITGSSSTHVFYSVDPNPGRTRNGTIAAQGALHAIVQAGPPPVGMAPFGTVDTPSNSANVAGAIAVTGWALDDREVVRIEVWRKNLPSEVNDQTFIGNATFVDGTRPDVAAAFPRWPFSSRAGWGLQVLTNMLPRTDGYGFGGDGTHQLYVYAYDGDKNRSLLGAPVIHVNNATSTKPFGALDTPPSGEIASGSQYLVWGWALTPQPASIPTDGSTISVWLDGQMLPGHPVYNLRRADIVGLFPAYANTDGAVGYYVLDTMKLANGLHTIAWSVTDNLGRSEGIGSRFFRVQN